MPKNRFSLLRAGTAPLNSGFLWHEGFALDLPMEGKAVIPYCRNALGWVAGELADADGTTHGFLWRNGTWLAVDASLPDSSVTYIGTQVVWINSAGQLVGNLIEEGGGIAGFVFTPRSMAAPNEGSFLRLPIEGAVAVIPQMVNAAGAVVGYARFPSGGGTVDRAFVWQRGIATPIVPAEDALDTLAIAINDAGWIVGHYTEAGSGRVRGFLWRSGSFVPLDVEGAEQTTPGAINNAGQIVGSCFGPRGQRSFFYDGSLRSLLPSLDSVQNAAAAINDAGDIVGFYADGGRRIGFLLRRGSIIPIARPGWIQTMPQMIDNAGTIVGYVSQESPIVTDSLDV